MSGKIAVEVDLICELEDITSFAPDFLPEDWRPMDTERLRSIVEYLDRHTSNEPVPVDMKVDNPFTPIVSDRIW